MDTIEQQLKDLILQRYGSVLEFSKHAGMPYSTIDSIFKRGVGKASISNIIRICKILGISTDSLAAGRISYTNPLPVNQEEMELLVLFRQLDPEKKQKVTQYAADMCSIARSAREGSPS